MFFYWNCIISMCIVKLILQYLQKWGQLRIVLYVTIVSFCIYMYRVWLIKKLSDFRALSASKSMKQKRFYFGQLKVKPTCITLSVLTSSSLPSDLLHLKRSLAVRLVNFEDAKVDLGMYKPFQTYNKSETNNHVGKNYGMSLYMRV